ncbi:Trm112 family protein [Desulfovibrio aminophilus]|nr:Trm112 family protein [Desulfovibrio aminophilus]MCM0756097.1 Trm112 family protein [Desulfovibrio aminophilus]
MTLHKDLLDILACPVCKGKLVLLPASDGLLCEACALVYPIKDEIPVMLTDEAAPLAKWTGSKPA